MVYLKEFESVEAYNTFAASEDFIEPNVSMIGEYGASGFAVKYNKDKPGPTPPAHDYSQDYLTIVVLENGGKFEAFYDDIYASIDNGKTWINISPEDGDPVALYPNIGDKILLKANIKQFLDSEPFMTFQNTSTMMELSFNVEGNVMSIYDSDGFRTRTSFDNSDDELMELFRDKKVISAENLILPATTLTDYCYIRMFQNCTSLTTAPELPATTLADGCYEQMFQGCTNLNYIKCLATDISATDCTSYWVDGVLSSGTFVKDASMTSWTTGVNGIPNGWTVQDAS